MRERFRSGEGARTGSSDSFPGALPDDRSVSIISRIDYHDSVSLRVEPGLAAIFGSEDRVRTLSALANSDSALTAYRVAAVMQMKPPNVYRELKRLQRAGVVVPARTPQGRSGWLLNEPLLRVFLRSRFRVSWSEDLLGTAGQRDRRAQMAVKLSALEPLDLSKFEPGRRLTASEARRRQEKDRILNMARARRSVRRVR